MQGVPFWCSAKLVKVVLNSCGGADSVCASLEQARKGQIVQVVYYLHTERAGKGKAFAFASLVLFHISHMTLVMFCTDCARHDSFNLGKGREVVQLPGLSRYEGNGHRRAMFVFLWLTARVHRSPM